MIAETPIKIARLSRCRMCGDAFRDYCRNDPHLAVVVINGGDANVLDAIVQCRPDVSLLDVDIQGGGFELAAQIKRRLDHVKLVFLAQTASDLCIKQALALGAKGILLKHEPAHLVVEQVKRVASGDCGFSEPVAQRLVRDSRHGQYQLKNGTPLDSLTDVQLEILRHLARGDSLKMVASKMNLSRKSVDGHKYRIMKKIGVRDRVLLSRFAIREGLIDA